MPRLLQINSCYAYGSTGRIVASLDRLAAGRGWETAVAHGRFGTPAPAHVRRIGGPASLRLHALATRAADRHGLHSRLATRRFLRGLQAAPPDLVHLHNLHGYYLNYPLLARWLRRANIPVVWTLHDCWPLTGHCAYFAYARCDRWQTACGRCPERRSYPASLLADRSARNHAAKKKAFRSIPDLTLAPVSEWMAGIARRSFLGAADIVTIQNGIDTETFRPLGDSAALRAKYNLAGQRVLVAAATSWTRRKGLPDYIDLAATLPPGYTIALVGLDPGQRRGLPPNIAAVPRTSDAAELAGLYSLAEATLNLSYEESFGLTTVEGMSCGTPGIVYNLTASPELVTPDTGFAAEARDFGAINRALGEIGRRGKEAYAQACRERATRHFDQRAQLGKYLDLYQTLYEKQQNKR